MFESNNSLSSQDEGNFTHSRDRYDTLSEEEKEEIFTFLQQHSQFHQVFCMDDKVFSACLKLAAKVQTVLQNAPPILNSLYIHPSKEVPQYIVRYAGLYSLRKLNYEVFLIKPTRESLETWISKKFEAIMGTKSFLKPMVLVVDLTHRSDRHEEYG